MVPPVSPNCSSSIREESGNRGYVRGENGRHENILTDEVLSRNREKRGIIGVDEEETVPSKEKPLLSALIRRNENK